MACRALHCYCAVQIAVCLSKAPLLLSQNLEDKLLPLCDYLNRIGLDLKKQRTLVTWYAHCSQLL